MLLAMSANISSNINSNIVRLYANLFKQMKLYEQNISRAAASDGNSLQRLKMK